MKNKVMKKIQNHSEELEKLVNNRMQLTDHLNKVNTRITELAAIIMELKALVDEDQPSESESQEI